MLYRSQTLESNARAFGRARYGFVAAALLCSSALFPCSAVAKTTAAPPIAVDGSIVDVAGLQRQNAVFVPVRGVFEKLGAEVNYVAPASIAVRKNGQNLAQMTVGSRSAKVKGANQLLEVAPFVAHGHAMVPLRLVSEAAGAAVAYRTNPRAIAITRPVAITTAPVAEPVVTATPVAEEHQGFPWWLLVLLALLLLGVMLFFSLRRKEPTIRTSGSVRQDPKIETRR